MKVVILTEAGKNIGFGHLTRCIAIYQAVEKKGDIAELIINSDNSILSFVGGKRYQLFNWLENGKKTKELIKNSDFVIIDSYLADKPLYDEISRLIKGKLLMIDDYKRLNYPKGVVVNPSIYGERLDYPKNELVEYLLGKDYIILRKEFWNIPEKKINKEIKDILITLGGIGNIDFLRKLSKFFSVNFPDFSYHVVTNSKFNFSPEKNNLNLYSSLSAQEMSELMLKTDICIAGGGQTTYELARVGVPTIGICFADNQRYNLKYGNLSGYLTYVGDDSNDRLFSKIKDAFEETIHFEQRARMSRLGRSNIDGQGVERILKIF